MSSATHQHAATHPSVENLSVILIVRNEAHNIRACLQSVAWAGEIIVVDSGSTDNTREIAGEFTPHVYTHDWPGFGPQKNRALSYATKEWVFSIDADERVTEALRDELIQAMRGGQAEAFQLPRLSSFCGRDVHHSGWYPDYILRLFKRQVGRFSDDLVHERVIVDTAVATLKKPLLHESFLSFEQLLNKINHYSSAGAQQMQKKGKRVSLRKALLHAGWAFFRTYVLRAGFLDGRVGVMLAISAAEGTYYRYVKLLLLNEGKL